MKISIIIPCYNVEKYIDRCLESIENQSIGIDNLEIILIDDASTDNTVSHLKAFEEKYPNNVILVLNKNNGKSGMARNIGYTYASGDYISYVDSDDIIDKYMYEKMLSVMLAADYDMVECDYDTFSEEKSCNLRGSGEIIDWNLSDINKRKHFIIDEGMKTAVWGRLYKREYIENAQLFFPENVNYEDLFFSALSMLLLNRVAFIKETLYFYYTNPEGIINKPNKEKVSKLLPIIHMVLLEMTNRGIFKKTFETYYSEMEYFYIWHGVVFPVNTLISYGYENWQEEAILFKNSILELFPHAANNVYLVNNSRNIKLLADIVLWLKG